MDNPTIIILTIWLSGLMFFGWIIWLFCRENREEDKKENKEEDKGKNKKCD